MSQIITALAVSLFTSVFNPSSVDEVKLSALYGPAKYKCAPHNWSVGPKWKGGLLVGKIDVDCEFEAISGGGFEELDNYLEKKLVNQAKKIHAGPNQMSFKKMPGVHYDATIVIKSKKDTIEVRQDAYLSTDKVNSLASTSVSKSVKGTGNSEYLKKIDIEFVITATKKKGHYKIQSRTYAEVDKPWYVPGGIFKSQVVKAIEKNLPKTQKKLINEIANNI